jgi:hypothetical protein
MVVITAGTSALAGTIHLTNGEIIRGKIVGVSSSVVTIQPLGMSGSMQVPLIEILDVEMDSGEQIYRTQLQRVRAGIGQETRRSAEARIQARQDTAPILEVPKGEAFEEVEATGPALSFAGAYDSPFFGFSLRYPASWERKQEGPAYLTFQDPRQEASGIWRFNVTVFERFDTDINELKKQVRQELSEHEEYKVLQKGHVLVAGLQGERTSGLFERDGLFIRHDVLIVENRRGHILMLHFFIPGGNANTAPEVDAVLRSIQLRNS